MPSISGLSLDEMKTIVLYITVFGSLCLALFAWKVDVTTKVLYTYYTNIKLMDVSKDVVTDSKIKDGAYNFVYFLSADRIIESRKNWIGKICSDRIETKDRKSIILRKNAEEYMRLEFSKTGF